MLQTSQFVTREIALRGAFRFDTEFELAVDLIAGRRIDLAPLLSGTFAIEDAQRAFEMASDKARSVKIQLAFQ